MTAETKLLERTISKTVQLRYLLYLPQDYQADPGQHWPLILFLHGAGERGDDLNRVKQHGLPHIAEHRSDLPYIIIAPQCPLDSEWSMETDGLHALLEEITTSYAVDQSRIYLTGLSMGGRGSWLLATLYPNLFAALVPVCGRRPDLLRLTDNITRLKHLPVWVFHGAQDEIVPLAESEVMVEALKAAGGDVRLTIYPDAGHDSWTQAYADPDLYTWLLQHRRPA